MQRFETPVKRAWHYQKENVYGEDDIQQEVEYYDRSDFTEYDNQSKFKVMKTRRRRFDKTPSPIKFNLEKAFSPWM